MLIDIIDWSLDIFALVLSVLVAKKILGMSWKEISILLCCFSVYALHEIWESSMIFPGTHKQFENWVLSLFLFF